MALSCAPARGVYRFRGRFESLSLGYGGTSQLIVKGDRRLAENTFGNLHGLVWEFDLKQELKSGECVDWLVSASPNGDNASDGTGLSLKIERYASLEWAWPLGFAGAVVAGLVAWRSRRLRTRSRRDRLSSLLF
jgi:hypothetical protein